MPDPRFLTAHAPIWCEKLSEGSMKSNDSSPECRTNGAPRTRCASTPKPRKRGQSTRHCGFVPELLSPQLRGQRWKEQSRIPFYVLADLGVVALYNPAPWQILGHRIEDQLQ